MLDNKDYRRTLRICNTCCFSTATVVRRWRDSVTLDYVACLCSFKHVTPNNCSCNLLHLLDKHDVEDVHVFLWTRWALLAPPKSWIIPRLPTYLKESLFFRADTVAQLLLQKLAYLGCDRTVQVRTTLPGSRLLCCSGKQVARTDRQHAQRHILMHPKEHPRPCDNRYADLRPVRVSSVLHYEVHSYNIHLRRARLYLHCIVTFVVGNIRTIQTLEFKWAVGFRYRRM